MTRPLYLVGAALFALTACTAEPADQQSGQTNVSVEVPNPTLVDDETSATTVNEVDTPTAERPTNDAAPADGTEPAPATLIPAQYRGRWAGSVEDCAGGANAKGLMVVSDTRVTMYEARGVLRKQLPSPTKSFRGQFDFEGEGLTWSDPVTFVRLGDKLRRIDNSNQKYTYIRCP